MFCCYNKKKIKIKKVSFDDNIKVVFINYDNYNITKKKKIKSSIDLSNNLSIDISIENNIDNEYICYCW